MFKKSNKSILKAIIKINKKINLMKINCKINQLEMNKK